MTSGDDNRARGSEPMHGDPTTRRLFVSQVGGERRYPNEVSEYNNRPLIHVLQVADGSTR